MHRRGIVALLAVREAKEPVRPLLSRLAHKAGIEKCVHPHGLCDTCDDELTMERISVYVIRKQLGHASLHPTTVYLEYIAPVELADTMRRRSLNL